MKTLTSMTDFVLEQSEILHKDQKTRNFNLGMLDFATNSIKYARFLKQPLAIHQFVPCKLVDGEWVVLEKPKNMADAILDGDKGKEWAEKRNEYKEALDKVLFEGFENSEIGYVYLNHEIHGRLIFDEEIFEDRTIEDLVTYNLPLTKTALKEIGL